MLSRFENLLRGSGLGDLTLVQNMNRVCDGTSKAHRMSHYNHPALLVHAVDIAEGSAVEEAAEGGVEVAGAEVVEAGFAVELAAGESDDVAVSRGGQRCPSAGVDLDFAVGVVVITLQDIAVAGVD